MKYLKRSVPGASARNEHLSGTSGFLILEMWDEID
jgi:hypothetical protein